MRVRDVGFEPDFFGAIFCFTAMDIGYPGPDACANEDVPPQING